MPLYDAFISYSHAKDKPVASALQSVIQRLGKPWYKRRALRVFRDDTSLSATPHLWPSIETALSQSSHLILLASPEAAQSPWIAKEVDYWLSHKSPDTLFIGLTDGDLAWDTKTGDFDWSATTPLPETLKGRFPDEPKWVDLRGRRDDPSARSAHMIEVGADFAAAIHGVPKEDLLSQELRQQRKALTLATSAAAALLVLTVLATWQWYRADSALTAAAEAANALVYDVAIEFRDIAGVPIKRVKAILDKTLALQSELANIGGDRADVQRNEALIHRELANTLMVQGRFKDALSHAKAAQDITERLVDADPANPILRRELSLSLNRAGEAQSKMGHHDAALDAFRKSLAIRQELASADDLEAQRDLAVSHERIGDTLRGLKQTDAALDAFDKALAIRKTLAASDLENGQWQLDLAVSYDKKGNPLLDAGEADAALAEYRKALAIRQKLVDLDPVSARYARDLSSSYIRVGDALAKAGRNDAAVDSFRKAIAIRRTLAKDESNVNAQVDLVLSLVKAADAGDDTLAHVTEANSIVRGLDAQGKLPTSRKDWVRLLEDWKRSLVP